MTNTTPHDHTVTLADGTTLAYTLHPAPAAGAPRLVLIHSLALDRSVWDATIAQLSTEAEILAYDCRGHGRSDRTAGPFTAELFARDLTELLDHIGWNSASLAGCSMGGCVALAFDFQSTRWFSDDFRTRHPEILQQALSVFVANDLDCYAATCALLGTVDVRAHVPTFRMHVAIVVGEQDYATPVTMARQLHDAIPQSTLTVLQDGRHLTPIEHPDAIASELRALMKRDRTQRV